MPLSFADSHAHITSEATFTDIDPILARAQEASVQTIINICTNKSTLDHALMLKQKYAWIHNTAATTPHDVEKEGDFFFPIVEQAAKRGTLVAIGETGLDYHYEHSPRETQKLFFKKYLHLALETNLPLIIHCREAFADFFSIIDQEYPSQRGVLHCFTGTLFEAQEVIKRGWHLSLSGIVTFKNSEELREVAKIVPLEQLLIETDTPYLAPQRHRGKPNEPAYLPEIAQTIAAIKGLSLETVAQQTYKNTLTFFQIG